MIYTFVAFEILSGLHCLKPYNNNNPGI